MRIGSRDIATNNCPACGDAVDGEACSACAASSRTLADLVELVRGAPRVRLPIGLQRQIHAVEAEIREHLASVASGRAQPGEVRRMLAALRLLLRLWQRALTRGRRQHRYDA